MSCHNVISKTFGWATTLAGFAAYMALVAKWAGYATLAEITERVGAALAKKSK